MCIVFHSYTFWYFIKEKTFYNLSTTRKSTPGKIEWKIFCFEFPPLFLCLSFIIIKKVRGNVICDLIIFDLVFLSMSHWSLVLISLWYIPFKSIYFKADYFLLQWTFQLEVWQGAICFKLQPPALVIIFWQADSYNI